MDHYSVTNPGGMEGWVILHIATVSSCSHCVALVMKCQSGQRFKPHPLPRRVLLRPGKAAFALLPVTKQYWLEGRWCS